MISFLCINESDYASAVLDGDSTVEELIEEYKKDESATPLEGRERFSVQKKIFLKFEGIEEPDGVLWECKELSLSELKEHYDVSDIFSLDAVDISEEFDCSSAFVIDYDASKSFSEMEFDSITYFKMSDGTLFEGQIDWWVNY